MDDDELRPEIQHVKDWLDGEREYAEGKWQAEDVDVNIDPEQYRDWVNSYIHRALILGVENPLGRQALAKATRTMVGFMESVVRRYGDIPAPGVPSGEVS